MISLNPSRRNHFVHTITNITVAINDTTFKVLITYSHHPLSPRTFLMRTAITTVITSIKKVFFMSFLISGSSWISSSIWEISFPSSFWSPETPFFSFVSMVFILFFLYFRFCITCIYLHVVYSIYFIHNVNQKTPCKNGWYIHFSQKTPQRIYLEYDLFISR